MDSGTQRFGVRWSRLVWVVTIAVTALVVIVTAVILRAAIHARAGDSAVWLLLVVEAFLPIIILVALALFAPRAYEVNPDAIVVKRLGPDVVVPRDEIQEVQRLEGVKIGFTLRLFGCGGFLGWFGLFYSRGLGEFWAYAGNQKDLVLLTRTDGRKIVLSPSPPEAFIAAAQETGESQS